MKILRAVAPGLLVGAALGAAEMCLRMRGSLDEASVARRAGSLVLYAAVLYSFVFALVGAVSAPLLRQYGDTPARRRIRSLGWIAFGVTTALLVAWMGDVLWQSTLAVRAGSLGLALGLGIGAGWLATGLARRLIGDRAIPPRSAASRLTWSVTALVAIGMGAGWGTWVQSRSAPPSRSSPSPAAADGIRPNILLVVADTLRPIRSAATAARKASRPPSTGWQGRVSCFAMRTRKAHGPFRRSCRCCPPRPPSRTDLRISSR